MNLLDLRGLRVAKDAETGEDIWYLVGTLGWQFRNPWIGTNMVASGFQNYDVNFFFASIWELEFNDI